MKILIAIILAFAGSLVQAQSIADTLEGNKVNHFQLLINNLNMLYLSTKALDKEKVEKADEPKEVYTKFRGDDENRIFINGVYSAPFPKVTSDQCKSLLEKERSQMVSTEKGLPLMINLVSFFDLSAEEIKEIATTARYQITIHARENKELSVSCIE